MNAAERTAAMRAVLETVGNVDRASLRLHDRKQGWLWELARLISGQEGFTPDFFENEAFREANPVLFGRSPGSGRSGRDGFADLLNAEERMELCRLLTRCAGHPETGIPSFLRLSFPDRCGITYVKNAPADAACRKFCRVIPEPTVTGDSSFQAVCEEVYEGRTAFCILPIASSTEGPLGGFRRLIDKYDLKIVYSCTVPAPDDAENEFVLCQKAFGAYPPQTGHPVRFRFSLPAPDEDGSQDGAGPGEVLTALTRLGAVIRQIDSMPAAYAGQEFVYDITVTANGADLSAAYAFLSLFAPRFTPVGLYSVLN